MTRWLILPLLLCAGCMRHSYHSLYPPDGLQNYIVRTHHCKLVRTVPDFSNIFPQQRQDQLWDCGRDGTMWILVSQIQPEAK